jgi:hypothetical protein
MRCSSHWFDLKGFAEAFAEAFDAKGFGAAFLAAGDFAEARRSFGLGFAEGANLLSEPREFMRYLRDLARPVKDKHWLKPLVAVWLYSLVLYSIVVVLASWILGPMFLQSVALTGVIVCGAGGLIGTLLAFGKSE